jgi:hypothetical protein
LIQNLSKFIIHSAICRIQLLKESAEKRMDVKEEIKRLSEARRNRTVEDEEREIL